MPFFFIFFFCKQASLHLQEFPPRNFFFCLFSTILMNTNFQDFVAHELFLTDSLHFLLTLQPPKKNKQSYSFILPPSCSISSFPPPLSQSSPLQGRLSMDPIPSSPTEDESRTEGEAGLGNSSSMRADSSGGNKRPREGDSPDPLVGMSLQTSYIRSLLLQM